MNQVFNLHRRVFLGLAQALHLRQVLHGVEVSFYHRESLGQIGVRLLIVSSSFDRGHSDVFQLRIEPLNFAHICSNLQTQLVNQMSHLLKKTFAIGTVLF